MAAPDDDYALLSYRRTGHIVAQRCAGSQQR
jgi:hypothetical protein